VPANWDILKGTHPKPPLTQYTKQLNPVPIYLLSMIKVRTDLGGKGIRKRIYLFGYLIYDYCDIDH